MKPFRLILIAGLAVVSLGAGVKTEEKTLVKFEGMMGRFVGMFGGKAAREGTINTVAVQGNRKITVNDTTGQIIDLDEEKIYELDLRGKSYKVTTFEEMRRRMQEARERMARTPPEPGGEPTPARERTGKEKEMEIDFSVKESGQKKNINGHDCREVVMTISAREKGKTLEEAGGMVMTTNTWLGPKIAAMKEIQEFDRRYAEKMAGVFGIGGEQMAMALAMYPAMQQMMGKFQTENVNMDGTAILTVMTMETVRSPQQAAAEPKPQAQESERAGNITSVRGLGGMLGRRIGKRKAESEPPAAGAGAASQTRATMMTSTHELVKISTSVAASELAIPAGFKEKK